MILKMNLCRRERSDHHWLAVTYDEGGIPADLLEDLAQIGWELSKYAPVNFPAQKPEHIAASGWGYEVPFTEHTIEGPSGSGLFGEWNKAERETNLYKVRRVLRHHGLKAPVVVKRLEDML